MPYYPPAGSGTPGGSNTNIQVNSSDTFYGDDSLTYLASIARVGVGSSTLQGSITLPTTTGNATVLTPSSATANWTLTLPSSPGTNTYVLQTDGSGVTSWVAPSASTGSVSPGGSDTYVQYNSSNTLAGSSLFLWVNSSNSLVVNGITEFSRELRASKTSSAYTILSSADFGTQFDTIGSTAASVSFSLPVALAGLRYGFCVASSISQLTVASTSGQISIGTANSTSGAIYSSEIYSYIELEGISSIQWVAKSVTGSWTVT